MQIIFIDEKHEQLYKEYYNRMKYFDEYHDAAAYLLSLDRVCREHTEDIFDFKGDAIKLQGLHQEWQTGTSAKTTRLLFNLWNGCYSDGHTYKDNKGYETELPSRYFTVDAIFSCSYAPYYWQAIQLRYPDYAEA